MATVTLKGKWSLPHFVAEETEADQEDSTCQSAVVQHARWPITSKLPLTTVDFLWGNAPGIKEAMPGFTLPWSSLLSIEDTGLDQRPKASAWNSVTMKEQI